APLWPEPVDRRRDPAGVVPVRSSPGLDPADGETDLATGGLHDPEEAIRPRQPGRPRGKGDLAREACVGAGDADLLGELPHARDRAVAVLGRPYAEVDVGGRV